MNKYNKKKFVESNLPRLDKMQYGLVSLCNEYLSDIPDTEKKYKLKKIRLIALHLTKTDKKIRSMYKTFLIMLYDIDKKDLIDDKIDNRIMIHIEVFDSFVYDLLKHLISIGKQEGYSGIYE